MALSRDASPTRRSLLATNHAEPGGRLMIFGRPTLEWEGAPAPEDYFRQVYGVDEVHTLDISPYEGATLIHDLNAPDLPEGLTGRYRAVSWGGSAQHVFCIGNVLRKSAELLEPGGLVFCTAPSNNRQETAYFQLCPTLKFDFYEVNGFDLGTSIATIFSPAPGGDRRFVPVYPGEAKILNYIPARVSHTLVAQKRDTSTSDRIPVSSAYRFRQSGERVRWRFRTSAPYDIVGGRKVAAPMRRMAIERARLKPISGGWAAPFADDACPPSVPMRPFRSRALVYENGRLLPFVVSDRAMVGERPGSFVHSGAIVVFSVPDGSDPTTNGRTYEIALPQPFDGLKPYASDPRYHADPA